VFEPLKYTLNNKNNLLVLNRSLLADAEIHLCPPRMAVSLEAHQFLHTRL